MSSPNEKCTTEDLFMSSCDQGDVHSMNPALGETRSVRYDSRERFWKPDKETLTSHERFRNLTMKPLYFPGTILFWIILGLATRLAWLRIEELNVQPLGRLKASSSIMKTEPSSYQCRHYFPNRRRGLDSSFRQKYV